MKNSIAALALACSQASDPAPAPDAPGLTRLETGPSGRTVEAVEDLLPVYARALSDGVERHLVGPPSKPVSRRWCR